jgi:hypothetical protein
MRPVSFREHVALKGQHLCRLTVTDSRAQICLLVLFLLFCIISRLIVGVI